MKRTWFLSALLTVGLAFGQDVMTISSGSGQVGESIRLPIYVRDTSGTPLDTGTHDVFSISLRLTCDADLVDDLSIVQAGATAGLPRIFGGDSSNAATGTVNWLAVFSEPLPLTLDAALPGELVGYLDVVPSSAALGAEITFTLDETFTSLSDSVDSETQANGQLMVNVGSVSVQAGQGLPLIKRFESSAARIIEGNSFTLSWEVEDADSVTLAPGGTVSAVGATTLSPAGSTTYTLTAVNGAGASTRMVTVEVVPAVSIQDFRVSPSQISEGDSAELSWLVQNSTSVTLQPGNIALAASGTRTVMPTVTTSYTLTAQGPLNQTVSRVVMVTVGGSGALSLSETSLDFGADTDVGSLFLTSGSDDFFDWWVDASPEWLSVEPAMGSIGNLPVQISLSVEREPLFPGERRIGQVVFAGDGLSATTLDVSIERAASEAGTTFLYFPEIQSSDTHRAVMVLANVEPSAVSVQLRVFDQGDGSYRRINYQLPGNGSLRHEFLSFNDGRGWAYVEARTAAGVEAPALAGCLVVRTRDGEELYGLSAVSEVSDSLFVPHIAADPNFYTNSSVVNLGQESDNLRFETGGQPSFSVVPATVPGVSSLFDYRVLMGGQIVGPGWGSLSYPNQASSGMVGVEVFGRSAGTGLRQSVGVSLSQEQSQRLLFPHIAANLAVFWTGIVVINPSTQAVNVDFLPYSDSGELIGGGFTETFEPGQKRTFLIAGDATPLGEGAAWLEVRANTPLIGYELFGTFDDRFAGFESVSHLGKTLVLPHVEEPLVEGGWTGLAIFNPDAETARLDVALLSRTGSIRASTTLSVPSKTKIVRLLTDLFSITYQEGDTVRIRSDKDIAGFELFGRGTQTMAGILAYVLVE